MTGRISNEQIAEWRRLEGMGMVSAVGEYTPDEFWLLLNEIERLRGEIKEAVELLGRTAERLYDVDFSFTAEIDAFLAKHDGKDKP
jgi:hypothetical protein